VVEKVENKLVCALLFGEADTSERARQIAERYKNCPYMNLMATKENQLFAALFLPQRQRWWIEYVGEKPRETFGLESAKVTIVDHVQYPDQLKMRLPESPKHISPCGSNCKACPSYEKCGGCPATTSYRHK